MEGIEEAQSLTENESTNVWADCEQDGVSVDLVSEQTGWMKGRWIPVGLDWVLVFRQQSQG